MEDAMNARNIATLDTLFLDELACVLDAERRFLDGLRGMLDGATSAGLRSAIEVHVAEGLERVDALGQAFGALRSRPRRVRSHAAEGLVAGADRAMKEIRGAPQVLDCAIASALARVGHHEVAAYRGHVALAKEMERDDLVEILLGNLEQAEETVAGIESAHPELIRRATREVVEG
jgi:ferritin-like metal-binding protein YciE